MKKLMILAVMMMVALNASAKETDTCKNIAEVAETIMDARQSGVSVVDMMEIAGDNDLMKKMVIYAYKQPKYNGAEFRRKEIASFKNEFYIACYEALN